MTKKITDKVWLVSPGKRLSFWESLFGAEERQESRELMERGRSEMLQKNYRSLKIEEY